ncbi:hypothetical protein F5882DRAFT_77427 [Hyaloscypha sp. PMI_1271]|nr:hypothetical protein F5882DRAFT_77427 [Hyaloscypha sp. PMI_1271]
MVDSRVFPPTSSWLHCSYATTIFAFFAIANISGAHGERNRGTVDPDLFVEISPCSAGQEPPSILWKAAGLQAMRPTSDCIGRMPLELSASFGGLTIPARKEKTKFLHLNQEQISQNQTRWRLTSVSGENRFFADF